MRENNSQVSFYKFWIFLIRHSKCSVCLCDFEIDEEVIQLPNCKHIFHPPCVLRWLEMHDSCPICRTPLRGSSNNSTTTTRSTSTTNNNSSATITRSTATTTAPNPSASSSHSQRHNNWQDIIEEEDLDWDFAFLFTQISFLTFFRLDDKISDQIKSLLGALPNPFKPIRWVATLPGSLFNTRKRLLSGLIFEFNKELDKTGIKEEDRATGAHDGEGERHEPPRKKRYLSTSR